MHIQQGKVDRLSCKQRQQRQAQRGKWAATSVQDVNDLSWEPLLRFLNGVINTAQISSGSPRIQQAAPCIQRGNCRPRRERSGRTIAQVDCVFAQTGRVAKQPVQEYYSRLSLAIVVAKQQYRSRIS